MNIIQTKITNKKLKPINYGYNTYNKKLGFLYTNKDK